MMLLTRGLKYFLQYIFLVIRVKFLHIQVYMFIQAFDTVVQFIEGKIIILGINCFKLTAVNRDIRLRKKLQTHAELIELFENFREAFFIIFSIISNSTKVRIEFL